VKSRFHHEEEKRFNRANGEKVRGARPFPSVIESGGDSSGAEKLIQYIQRRERTKKKRSSTCANSAGKRMDRRRGWSHQGKGRNKVVLLGVLSALRKQSIRSAPDIRNWYRRPAEKRAESKEDEDSAPSPSCGQAKKLQNIESIVGEKWGGPERVGCRIR